MQAFLNTAVQAARRAGDTAAGYLNRAERLEIHTKARNEFVTQVDHAAEEIIIDTIRERYPDHAFLAEESGRQGEADNLWIIDPLDGTTNFVHGFPVFAVSIALQVRGQLEVAVVYDPMRQELFTAARGQGAQLDGRRIRVSNLHSLEGALIGTGFPYRANATYMDRYLGMLQAVLESTAGIRRPGAAALDLAYVAAGRLDGFWEFGLSTWDMAAGALLIREAGGMISELDDAGDFLETGNVIGGNPKVHDGLKQLFSTPPAL
ncbi:MAG: inositol monophosphatase family protein [Gammaproteobacteria bacterium]|nr:inositol monophosphatase family protein [Gammaproteobacteria bacterium]